MNLIFYLWPLKPFDEWQMVLRKFIEIQSAASKSNKRT